MNMLSYQFHAFLGVRIIADNIAKAHDCFNIAAFNVGEDGFQRFNIAMNVRDDSVSHDDYFITSLNLFRLHKLYYCMDVFAI